MEAVQIIPAVDADVVAKLEELLAEAKAGNLDFIAYAVARPNRNFTTNWVGSGPASCLEISGLIGTLWWEFQNGVNKKEEVPAK